MSWWEGRAIEGKGMANSRVEKQVTVANLGGAKGGGGTGMNSGRGGGWCAKAGKAKRGEANGKLGSRGIRKEGEKRGVVFEASGAWKKKERKIALWEN